MDIQKRNSQSKIIFGPGDKLWFLEGVARDVRMPGLDLKVAVGIANRIDKYSGTATVGHAWLAKFIGASERGVRYSVNRLERFGHMAVHHADRGPAIGGRHKANIYTPKTRNGGAGFSDGNPELVCHVSSAETRQSATGNLANSSTKPGTGVPTLPNIYLNSTTPRDAGALEGATSRWLEIKEGLSTKIGQDKSGPSRSQQMNVSTKNSALEPTWQH